eukprot:TRINITY_DN3111_c0_g2_i2.p1 TRINITY_DN3111_c0_g2~~TRINITY_DN3111_c0_g2_i2.p1  ORF type:complete len:902 (+),score=55.22 TRINITY_DN3111_c0_g2_i2:211-2916(+)
MQRLAKKKAEIQSPSLACSSPSSAMKPTTQFEHIKKTAEILQQVQHAKATENEILQAKLTKAECLVETQAHAIQRLEANRVKLETIVQEETKRAERNKFDMLSSETLLRQVKSAVEKFQSKLKEGEDDRDYWKAQHQSVKDEIAKLVDELNACRIALEEEQHQRTVQAAELQRVQECISAHRSEIDALANDKSELLKKSELLEQRVNELLSELQSAESEKKISDSEHEREIALLHEKLAVEHQSLLQANSTIEHKTVEINNLSRVVADRDAQLKLAIDRESAVHAQLSEVAASRDEVASQLIGVEKDLAKATETVQSLTAHSGSLQTQATTLHENEAQLRNTLHDLDDHCQQLTLHGQQRLEQIAGLEEQLISARAAAANAAAIASEQGEKIQAAETNFERDLAAANAQHAAELARLNEASSVKLTAVETRLAESETALVAATTSGDTARREVAVLRSQLEVKSTDFEATLSAKEQLSLLYSGVVGKLQEFEIKNDALAAEVKGRDEQLKRFSVEKSQMQSQFATELHRITECTQAEIRSLKEKHAEEVNGTRKELEKLREVQNLKVASAEDEARSVRGELGERLSQKDSALKEASQREEDLRKQLSKQEKAFASQEKKIAKLTEDFEKKLSKKDEAYHKAIDEARNGQQKDIKSITKELEKKLSKKDEQLQKAVAATEEQNERLNELTEQLQRSQQEQDSQVSKLREELQRKDRELAGAQASVSQLQISLDETRTHLEWSTKAAADARKDLLVQVKDKGLKSPIEQPVKFSADSDSSDVDIRATHAVRAPQVDIAPPRQNRVAKTTPAPAEQELSPMQTASQRKRKNPVPERMSANSAARSVGGSPRKASKTTHAETVKRPSKEQSKPASTSMNVPKAKSATGKSSKPLDLFDDIYAFAD